MPYFKCQCCVILIISYCSAVASSSMKKAAYVYNDAITSYHFSKEHPMKTKRIKMAHSLIQTFGMGPYLNMFMSKEATS